MSFSPLYFSSIVIDGIHIFALHIQPAKKGGKKGYRWIPGVRQIPNFRPPRPSVPQPPPMYNAGSDVIATVVDPNDFNGGQIYEPDYGNTEYGYEDTKDNRGGGNIYGGQYPGYGSIEYKK